MSHLYQQNFNTTNEDDNMRSARSIRSPTLNTGRSVNTADLLSPSPIQTRNVEDIESYLLSDEKDAFRSPVQRSNIRSPDAHKQHIMPPGIDRMSLSN